MIIYVDADACPVKDDITDMAIRHDVQTIMVCNGGIRPHPHPLISLKIVSSGPDEADKWIAESATYGDIVITNDIPLAAKAIDKQAYAIRPDGSEITPHNIGNILATRDLMTDIRAANPFHQSRSAPFSKADRAKFKQTLSHILMTKGPHHG